jgi:hypothetical protein
VADDDWAAMEVTQHVAVGAEVYNSYGQLSNAALLARYGFTHEANPEDAVTVSAALVRATCAVEGGMPGGWVRERTMWCQRAGTIGCC